MKPLEVIGYWMLIGFPVGMVWLIRLGLALSKPSSVADEFFSNWNRIKEANSHWVPEYVFPYIVICVYLFLLFKKTALWPLTLRSLLRKW